MRVNFKKITLVGVVLLLLWLIVSFSSPVMVPKSVTSGVKDNSLDIEVRLDQLQHRMDDQIINSNKLLENVQKYLSEQDNAKDQMQEVSDKDRPSSASPVLPVLVIACNRPTVKRCLDNLIKFRPNKETFPIIVSQDCGHNETYHVIKRYADADPSITVVRQPDLSEIPLPSAKVKFRGYYKISRHYKFAFGHVFNQLRHEAVIIVEDDLDISPDFFEYFLGTYPLLKKDPSIWCISAWNDNGKKGLIDTSSPELLYRTDFFPGLGWMLQKETWHQLEPNWPQAFFDDWLRDPVNTHGRACIRPEISRTYSFGKVGVSKGLFFDMHLKFIQLNIDYVEFTKLDLSYLMKDAYDARLTSQVRSLPQLSAAEAARPPSTGERGAVRVPYKDAASYKKAAKALGLMDDCRSGIPRTAYLGIVTCFKNGRRIYLAPDYEWSKYDPNWG